MGLRKLIINFFFAVLGMEVRALYMLASALPQVTYTCPRWNFKSGGQKGLTGKVILEPTHRGGVMGNQTGSIESIPGSRTGPCKGPVVEIWPVGQEEEGGAWLRCLRAPLGGHTR